MALYLISYDINEKDKFEYENLWAHLKKIGAMRILYSEWIVKGSSNGAVSIYNGMASLVQTKDRLLVLEVAYEAVWDKLMISDDTFKQLMQSARGA